MSEIIGLMDIPLYDTEIPHIYKQDVAKTKDREKRKVTHGFIDFCNTRGMD